jgi:HSP20 family molecular chaperone IbpA
MLAPMRSGALMAPDCIGKPFRSLQRKMHRRFDDAMLPELEIQAENSKVVLLRRMEMKATGDRMSDLAELPGVVEKDIGVALNDGVMTIRAVRKIRLQSKAQGSHHERQHDAGQRAL